MALHLSNNSRIDVSPPTRRHYLCELAYPQACGRSCLGNQTAVGSRTASMSAWPSQPPMSLRLNSAMSWEMAWQLAQRNLTPSDSEYYIQRLCTWVCHRSPIEAYLHIFDAVYFPLFVLSAFLQTSSATRITGCARSAPQIHARVLTAIRSCRFIRVCAGV